MIRDKFIRRIFLLGKMLGFILMVPLTMLFFGLAQSAISATEEAKLTASDAYTNDAFGGSLAVEGNTAVIGAYWDDDQGTNSGSAYVFTWDGASWNEQAKLTASDGTAFDQFGWSVAMDGDTTVVGANYDDDQGSFSGSAYVFTWDGVNWNEQAKLVASDAVAGDQFGISVAVDGDTIVVGAIRDDDQGSDSGSAYVFTWDGVNWNEQAKLVASDGAALDEFGTSVAIQGDTILVGNPRDDGLVSSTGSAYVFTWGGASWNEQAKLTASDGPDGKLFGFSVALDGNTALIGSPNANGPNDINTGAAYVFTWDGASWTEQVKLHDSGGENGDAFGISVALDGEAAVIGSDLDDDQGSFSGSAYVFTGSNASWTQEAKLTASDGLADDRFGHSVAIGGDLVLIGAFSDDGSYSNSGSAYVIRLPSTQPTIEEAKLTASDAYAVDQFGGSVAIDGDTALIGAINDDDNGTNSGSAYIFTWDGTSWTQEGKLTASDGTAFDSFGWAVALDGDTAVIGANYDDDQGSYSGSAYVFTRIGTAWTEQAKLLPADVEDNDLFGYSVAVDADNVVVGAISDDDNGTDSGSAYVFSWDGASWNEQAKLTASDGAAGDAFGTSVAVQGDTFLIGSPQDDGLVSNTGSAYVFTWDGASWNEAKLTANNGADGRSFGRSVALDGATSLIGAPQANGPTDVNTGAAYVFTWDGANWSEQVKLLDNGGVNGDSFGISVDLDGETAVIGSDLDDDLGGNSGSAFIFTGSNANWTQLSKLTASDGQADDRFGHSVAVDGDQVLIGAFFDDDSYSNSGSAYVVRLISNQPPLSQAGGPYNGEVGNAIPLDGSGSTDPDDDLLTYSWTVDSTECSFNDATIMNPSLTCDAGGSYSVNLLVSDGTESDSSDATVTVNNTTPALSSISPSATRVGGLYDLTLYVYGTNFASGAKVRWNGTDLTTTFVSDAELIAIIPGNNFLSVGLAYITVFNPTPGGGESTKQAFFITERSARIVSASTAESVNGTATASTGATGVTATATGGNGTLSVAEYDRNPGETIEFGSGRRYFDIHISPDATFTYLNIELCMSIRSRGLYWYDGTSWRPVSDFIYNPPCYTVSVTNSTSPSLNDLSGTPFAVVNLPPVANAAGPYLGAVNTDIDFDGSSSSDPEEDPLTYAWDFGDTGTDLDSMPTHSYTLPGIYDVCLTVNDGSQDSDSNCTLAVVYDPDGGFVTGGGWIDSPEGAYTADLSLTGKASFGFVSKYKKGASEPTGQTQFQFKAGDLNFHSDSYDWLVIAGANAKYKGVGTINGAGEYYFMLTATDGDLLGGGAPDSFRIKIWDDNGIVYDNKMGLDDDSPDGTDLSGGNIKIHKK